MEDEFARERNSFPTHCVPFQDTCAEIVFSSRHSFTHSDPFDEGYAPSGPDIHDGD